MHIVGKTAPRRTTAHTTNPQKYQAQADALFSSIGEGAIATDVHGRITRINQAACDMLACTEDDVLGKWLPEIIRAQDRHGVPLRLEDRPITQSLVSGEVINETMTYICQDGSLLPVNITVSPILLDGTPIGAIEVFRDISHEQEVDRMKTEFIYLASHQLRTPLSAIKTYAHMLAEGYRGELTEGQAAFMKIIMSSLDRMNEIINTLLNISRIESGVMAVTPATVHLKEIVEQSLAELEPAMAAKQIKLIMQCGLTTPVTSDQLLVKEVCLNLLSNAVKYTPEGGSITVSLREHKDTQVLAIKDTGYGIPADAQAQIFGKFYRAPNILEQEGEGTGLGLYLVKGIAEVLGGKVWFKSEENKGSTFYFSLPAADPAGSPKRAGQRTPARKSQSIAHMRSV